MEDWKYINMGATLDGGSLTLLFENSKNQEQTILFVQNVFREYYEELSTALPGRIYINSQLIDKRSKEENEIIDFLQDLLLPMLNDSERSLLVEKINWIKSKDYLNFEPIKLELSEKRKRYQRTNHPSEGSNPSEG